METMRLLLKHSAPLLVVGLNLILLVWAIRTYRQKKSMPDDYYRWIPLSAGVALFPVLLGLYFWYGMGLRAGDHMHFFYGIMVTLGATAQLALYKKTRLGQRFRGKPLMYAFWNLFLLLLSLRGWMSGAWH